jgi:hypothetical protein
MDPHLGSADPSHCSVCTGESKLQVRQHKGTRTGSSFVIAGIVRINLTYSTCYSLICNYNNYMRCRIDLPSEIPAGECELAADFAGKVRSGLQGVYLNRQAGNVANLES